MAFEMFSQWSLWICWLRCPIAHAVSLSYYAVDISSHNFIVSDTVQLLKCHYKLGYRKSAHHRHNAQSIPNSNFNVFTKHTTESIHSSHCVCMRNYYYIRKILLHWGDIMGNKKEATESIVKIPYPPMMANRLLSSPYNTYSVYVIFDLSKQFANISGINCTEIQKPLGSNCLCVFSFVTNTFSSHAAAVSIPYTLGIVCALKKINMMQ